MKTIRLFLILHLGLIRFSGQTQEFLWVDRIGLDGSGNDTGKAIALDSKGNICLTGLVKNNSSFGEGSNTVTLNGFGTHDIFVARYDNNGILFWARRFGSIGSDTGMDIAVDSRSNVYVTGYFENSSDFGDTALVSYGSFDIFVVSIDSLGNNRWVTSFNGASDDQGYSIIIGDDSSLYVCGYYYNKLYYNNYADSIISEGSSDMFIAKMNLQGKVVWMKSYGGVLDDQGYAITYYQNRLYSTGYFKSTANFGGINIAAGLAKDFFISCLDTAGMGIWVKKETSNKNDIGHEIFVHDGFIYAFLESNHNINISGHAYTQFSNNLVGNIDGYLVKYDILGNYQNSLQIASSDKDYQQAIYVNDDFVFIGGITEGNLHIEGVQDSITNVGGADIHMLVFNHDLDLEWYKHIENTPFSGKFPAMHEIIGDSLNNIYVTGGFLNTTLFDTVQEVASGWSVDVYLGKISPRPIANVINPSKTACENEVFSFVNESTYNTTYFEWHFPGSNTPVSYDSIPSVLYTTQGSYDYYLVVGDGINFDSVYYSNAITIQPNEIINLGEDTSLCFNVSYQLSYTGASTILWNTGETNNSISIDSAGIYAIQVTNGFGCISYDSIVISFYENNTPILPTDSIICYSDTISIGIDGNLYTSILWSNGSTQPILEAVDSAFYYVSVIDTNGCSYQSSNFELDIYPYVNVNLGSDTAICDNAEITLSVGQGFLSYLWNTGEITESVIIDTAGIYSIQVIDGNNCLLMDSISITEITCLGILENDGLENFVTCYKSFNKILVSCFDIVEEISFYSIDGRLLQQDFNTIKSSFNMDLISNQLIIVYVRNLDKEITFKL